MRSILKGLIMAGGLGTRLQEAKCQLNKHTIPVYDRPMIAHTVSAMVEGGVTDILVMLNYHYPQSVLEILEDGREFGCRILYSYLREAHGPGRELSVAREFVGGESFVVMLGDGLFLEPLEFQASVSCPHMWLSSLHDPDTRVPIDDPSKYCQVKVDGNRVLEIKRKPEQLFSKLIQTGVWHLPPTAFDVADELSRSSSEEVHVGQIVEEYLKRGNLVEYSELPFGSYLDLGTPEALFSGAKLVRKRRKHSATKTDSRRTDKVLLS